MIAYWKEVYINPLSLIQIVEIALFCNIYRMDWAVCKKDEYVVLQTQHFAISAIFL